jgi:hypothetical protein
MSLRMNLYGWKLQEFIDVIGSKSAKVLETASAHLAEKFKGRSDHADLPKAIAWLRTLINEGHPLRQDRERPTVGADGDLVVMHMEAGIHVAVINSLVVTLRREEFLNPAFDSWSQGISSAIHKELRVCGFIGSSQCSVEFLQALWRLDGGTPLFGDDFCTGWEYYSIIENDQIAALVTSFEAALRFERILPDGIPEEARKRLRTRLSDDVREFLGNLIGWFGQIHQAGQDAFITWS